VTRALIHDDILPSELGDVALKALFTPQLRRIIPAPQPVFPRVPPLGDLVFDQRDLGSRRLRRRCVFVFETSHTIAIVTASDRLTELNAAARHTPS
jgi:hypothetical protein